MPVPHSLGIDVGSLFVKAVALDAGGAPLWWAKERHRGNVSGLVDHYLRQVNGHAAHLATTSRANTVAGAGSCDPVTCLTAGVRALCPGATNILEVGGSRLTLVRLSSSGQIVSVHRNSLCAAGTGSFLDEQAARLGIDYESNHDAPMPNPPAIATRCAVFAKTDITHRQQEGYARDALWSGLCRGLAEGVIRTLTCGQPLGGRTALCGGVALNRSFVWWLERALLAHASSGRGVTLEVVTRPDFTTTFGAALLAARAGRRATTAVAASPPADCAAPARRRPALSLFRSRYPETRPVDWRVDAHGTETCVHGPASAGSRTPVFLGIDVGSTSTKCVLTDSAGRMLVDAYRRTEGDPIGACMKLLNAIVDVDRAHGFRFDVRAAATTGSGRKLIGTVVGTDVVVNEISAHGAGAVHLDPSVETIFEIGGQDAKYLSVRDGRVVDANMNHVCAAGTGSFVEALAAKLGYGLAEAGTATLGVAPPFTNTRCTVFMEQDVLDLLDKGMSRPEVLGAVLYSVVENYLHRVVGNRRVSRDRIHFQGATARNRALVAAIENLLAVEVVVSPHCHVVGAFGAALLARAQASERTTRFRGLELGLRPFSVEAEICHLCRNACRISRVSIEGVHERPAWGMACGRGADEPKREVPAGYAAFQKRIQMAATSPAAERSKPTRRPAAAEESSVRVALVRALTTFSFLQFWTACFDELGVPIVLDGPTDQACLERGKQCAGAELCLPIQAAHGHAARALASGAADAVFLPHMIAGDRLPGVSNAKFCPYVESAPSLIRAAIAAQGIDQGLVISPIIDLSVADRFNAASLARALRPLMSLSQARAEKALMRARAARECHLAELAELGRSVLARVAAAGEIAVVLIGRPYNTLDPALSLDLPRFIAECGVEVIPMDCLPFEPATLSGEFQNMFWHYGQRIVSALTHVAGSDNLYAVYLTNFGCGPDSFILSYAEAIMGPKPMLVLELDDHGSSGGYQTRIEAFLDVVRASRNAGHHRPRTGWAAHRSTLGEGGRRRTLWFPQMHPVGARLLAAAVRSGGVDARVLPLEDDESHAIGRRLMRGSECLPAPLTVGTFLKQVERGREAGLDPASESAFFMPTACGPCRFGQYRTLHRLVLDRLGYQGIPIVSPGSKDTYFELKPITLVWECVVASDILFKMRCRVRPYEAASGDTDETLERWVRHLETVASSGGVDWDAELGAAMKDFLRIPVRPVTKPLVGIVGEVYVRCNPYANSGLVESIERLGGEAWLAPLTEWFEYTAWMERHLAWRDGRGPADVAKLTLKRRWVLGRAHRMYRPVRRMLHDRLEPELKDVLEAGRTLLPVEFQGESILTVGRAMQFERDGCQLVVNCAPFGCMHGNITAALFEQTGGRLRVPVLSVFYGDGADTAQLSTFLQQATRKSEAVAGNAPLRT